MIEHLIKARSVEKLNCPKCGGTLVRIGGNSNKEIYVDKIDECLDQNYPYCSDCKTKYKVEINIKDLVFTVKEI